MEQIRYGRLKNVDTAFDATVLRVKEELRKEGFGVLTEIDVRDTFRNKLDKPFRPYTILGACNPSLAWTALEAEPEIGLLLPCGVVIQETRDGTGVTVSIASPEAMFSLVDNPAVLDLAREGPAKPVDFPGLDATTVAA
jgi:uncharacterized protein (DUF302 family)